MLYKRLNALKCKFKKANLATVNTTNNGQCSLKVLVDNKWPTIKLQLKAHMCGT